MGVAARRAAEARAWGPVFDTVYRAYDVALGRVNGTALNADPPYAGVSEEQSAA